MKHEPLQLVQPQFEMPLPALQPAVSVLRAPTSGPTACPHCGPFSALCIARPDTISVTILWGLPRRGSPKETWHGLSWLLNVSFLEVGRHI